MIQDGLVSLLGAAASINSLLGTSRGDGTPGVFGLLAISGATTPYIVYQRVAGDPEESYQGANKLHYARFRFSCHGSSYPSAVTLAEALKLFFATYTGTLPDGTVVQQVQQIFESDDMEALPKGTLYGVHVDFAFCYIDKES